MLANKWIHIRNIYFEGNSITKQKIIERELRYKAGDSILASEIETELKYNKKRVFNLQLFAKVEDSICFVNSNTIDITYKLNELFYWLVKPLFSLADRNINVWWYEQHHRLDRSNIGLEFIRQNFRGRNETIGGSIQLGYNKNFDLFYKIPYIDKNLKKGLSFNLNYATGREISYFTDNNKLRFFRSEHYPYQKFQGKIAYTYRHQYASIHEINLSYNFFNISQQLFDLNKYFIGFDKRRINYFELNYIYKYNNTDIRLYPMNGIDLKTTITKRGLGIDKDINQFSAGAEMSYYKPINKLFSTAFVFRGRLSFPQQQPYYFNHALGFKNDYLRGYEYYVIDGSHFGLLRSNVRLKIIDRILHQRLLKIVEFIPIKLYGKVFDDIGYVYNKYQNNSALNNKILNGYGVGLDLLLSYYVKLRIEYSFNHLNQNSLFLHSTKE